MEALKLGMLRMNCRMGVWSYDRFNKFKAGLVGIKLASGMVRVQTFSKMHSGVNATGLLKYRLLTKGMGLLNPATAVNHVIAGVKSF